MIHRDRDLRGHFISLLYDCRLDGAFIPKNTGKTPDDRPNEELIFTLIQDYTDNQQNRVIPVEPLKAILFVEIVQTELETP